MSGSDRVRIGVAGIGGYAKTVRDSIERCAEADLEAGRPTVELAATCDPRPEDHTKVVEALRGRGVEVFEDYQRMLEAPIDAVWLPVPIHLHRPFTEAAFDAGKAVVCEKPAAGTVEEVDAMIAARDAAGLAARIAYQHMHEARTPLIRRRLAEGAIGPIRRASVWGCWPRGDDYYARNDWAGALRRNGTWVLDSPMQNAMSHHLQLMLHFIGRPPAAVEAELYRTRPIENCDTVSLRLGFDGARAVVLMTHACSQWRDVEIVVEGESGRLTWTARQATLEDADGRTIESFDADPTSRPNIARGLAAAVRGEPTDDLPGCTIEQARPPIVVTNAAAEAGPIHTLPDEAYEVIEENGVRAINGIEAAFKRCAEEGLMLHESGELPWTTAGRSIETRGYSRFAGPFNG